MGIKNALDSLRKTSIILLQAYALNNVCFIYLLPFYIDMYLFLNIYYYNTRNRDKMRSAYGKLYIYIYVMFFLHFLK